MDYKGFGNPPEEKFTNIREQVNKKVRKLKKYLKKPLIESGLLDR